MTEKQKVTINDNLEISYRWDGDRDKPVILFVNGSIFNFHQFDLRLYPRIRSQLGDDFSYLFYDYVGIGESSEKNDNFDFVEIAEQQLQFLDALSIERVHLFGYSKGSIISQIMTARYQNRVLSLAGYGNPNLVDQNADKFAKKEFGTRLSHLEQISDLWEERIDNSNFRILYDTVFVPTIFDNTIDEIGFFDKIKNWWVRSMLRPMLEGTKIKSIVLLYQYYLESIKPDEIERYTEAIKSIQVPTLLVHGKDDETVPISASRLLHDWISSSRLVELEGFTHTEPILLPWKAKTVANVYVEFIQSLYDDKADSFQLAEQI